MSIICPKKLKRFFGPSKAGSVEPRCSQAARSTDRSIRDGSFPHRIPTLQKSIMDLQHTGKHRHVLQVAHEPHLPQRKVFGREVGEALVTTNRARFRAQRLIAQSHHVSVRGPDAEKFVKREDKARIGRLAWSS